MCWKTIFSLVYRTALVAPVVAKAELLLFFWGVFSSVNVVGKSVSLLYSWMKLCTKMLKSNVLKLWLKSKALKFLFNLKVLESWLEVNGSVHIRGFEKRHSCLWEQALRKLKFSQQLSNCVLWELQVCNTYEMRQLSSTELDLPCENAGADDLSDFTGLVSKRVKTCTAGSEIYVLLEGFCTYDALENGFTCMWKTNKR